MTSPVQRFLAGISDSGRKITLSKTNKKLILATFSSVLVVAAVIGIVARVNSVNNSKSNSDLSSIRATSTTHTVLISACSSTLYPDLCFSTLESVPEMSSKVTSQKDVIELFINITTRAVKSNIFSIEKLFTWNNLTKREKCALHDCLETTDETLHELHKAVVELGEYPKNSKKSLFSHSNDLKTFLSSAITNQVTCIGGFSHDRNIQKFLVKGQKIVEKLCSNVLAMIKNMTDTDMDNNMKLMEGRKLKEEEKREWPEWMSVGDRRLLHSSSVRPNVVVAADGSGNYRTISAAVAAAPSRRRTRYVIRIKAGVYRENVEIPSSKTNIMFLGDGRSNTIITARRNVVDESTTFFSATVAAVGDRFLARDITFQNAAGPSKHQAVALRVGSDLSAFYRCAMLAYQDTLYVHSNRQFYVNCIVVGTVDFIFGNAAVVLQNCDIKARRPNPGQKNMVTAQGRTDPNQNTGIVLHKCRIGPNYDLSPVQSSFPTYLGRPWQKYSRTIVMQSTITDMINPDGWYPWDGNFALNTLFYGEYANTGAGASTSKRVTWRGFKEINSVKEARSYAPGRFISGGSWLSSTDFPYSLAAVGDRFLARDITFQNAAGPSKHQAVALRVGSDLSAFYRCAMLAYQDTLYVHSNRQFYVNCIVVGTVDFIFGNAAVVLQNCDIKARRPNPGQKNMVTAQGRTDPNQNTGIVLHKCRIGPNSDLSPVQSSFPTYLGRPWQKYSRTIVMQSTITDMINPDGWYPWDGNFALNTLFYGEYANTGAGASTSKRVTWRGFKEINSVKEARSYAPGRFISGGSWLSSTDFPYSLGL